MKISLLPLVLLSLASATMANTPPTVVIQSAAMRPGTTLMDVVFRVNDPDDATVKTRALAFVNGTRSFAKVLKPVTFVEGTAAKLGDAIPTNVDHKLTWNVAADWNVDLGQVKFEVLAMDQRGLLPFDWITIPAAGGKPSLTISKDAPTDDQVLNALFWQYAAGDTWLSLSNGVLRGSSASGVFDNVKLASGTTLGAYGTPFIFKRMNLAVSSVEINFAANARAGLLHTDKWHALNRVYGGVSVVVAWGSNQFEQTEIPLSMGVVTAIDAGLYGCLALKSDGTVVVWGNPYAQTNVPDGLSGITAISAGVNHFLALKSDGTVVAWGDNFFGGTTVPAGLSGVTAVAAGEDRSLALKSDGTVVGWGIAIAPSGLSEVTAIQVSGSNCLALKSNGTVVAWGNNSDGQTNIPAGLSGVTAIATSADHSLALKSNGTVVAWGNNNQNQTTIPAGLSGVIAVSAGRGHSLALKSDGTVVAWGDNNSGQTTIPAGSGRFTAIATGSYTSYAIKAEEP